MGTYKLTITTPAKTGCCWCSGRRLIASLGERRGIGQFGSVYCPMDEALARLRGLVGAPGREYPLRLRRRSESAAIATESLTHVMQSLSVALRFLPHVDVLRGENDHHRAEALKALALALRQAPATRTGERTVPSTKGAL